MIKGVFFDAGNTILFPDYYIYRDICEALGIEVGPKVHLLRSLMHLGETLESDSLHVYVLALPDFLGYPSAIAMMDNVGALNDERMAETLSMEVIFLKAFCAGVVKPDL